MRQLIIRLDPNSANLWDLRFGDDEHFEGLTTAEVHEYIAVRVYAAMDSILEG